MISDKKREVDSLPYKGMCDMKLWIRRGGFHIRPSPPP